MHPEIQRAQGAILHVLHNQQDRLELLSRRQLDELRSEAELILRDSNGTLRVAAEITLSICTNALGNSTEANQGNQGVKK